MSGSTPPSGPPLIHVVGVGADGWDGLAENARSMVLGATVVLGARRHLDTLPAAPGQWRAGWPSPLRDGLPALLASLGGGPVVALASGDPLVSGIGTTLIELFGRDRVAIYPAISSVALARAALRWPAESHAVVSVVGRDVSLVRRELAPGRRILVLSSDERTPGEVAELLVEAGYGDSGIEVLGDLGGKHSSSYDFDRAWLLTAKQFTFPRLNIVAVTCAGPPVGGWLAGLPDDAFEHDGQLTKRDLRASALARLAPTPGDRLWDVGAGAGSIGIEWMRAHPTCSASAIEVDADRAARIGRNAGRLGVPGLQVVTGRAPEALAGLPGPDAIFVGGGATSPGVLDTCLAALGPGGRIVVHGVTLETEQVLAEAYRARGGELSRIAVDITAPIGTFTGWSPGRTVTQWTWTASA